MILTLSQAPASIPAGALEPRSKRHGEARGQGAVKTGSAVSTAPERACVSVTGHRGMARWARPSLGHRRWSVFSVFPAALIAVASSMNELLPSFVDRGGNRPTSLMSCWAGPQGPMPSQPARRPPVQHQPQRQRDALAVRLPQTAVPEATEPSLLTHVLTSSWPTVSIGWFGSGHDNWTISLSEPAVILMSTRASSGDLDNTTYQQRMQFIENYIERIVSLWEQLNTC